MTWLCTPYITARGSNTVRLEEMDGDAICQTRTPNSMCSILGVVHFDRPGLHQDNRIPAESE